MKNLSKGQSRTAESLKLRVSCLYGIDRSNAVKKENHIEMKKITILFPTQTKCNT